MESLNKIILETSDEKLENIISPFIREQFPNFVREDYGKLVLFLKAYYEWAEQEGNAGYVMSKLDTVWDVDQNLEQFFSHFQNTYLIFFPEVLAENESGEKPNKTTLLKKIRDFYGNKGTESAYKFLFRILHDSDLDIYYPKKDILKVSDGQWIEAKSIKTTSTNGSALFSAKGGNVYQYDGKEVVASAFVDDVVQYYFGGNQITEFFINDILGNFAPNKTVKVVKDTVELEEAVYPVLGEFFVELPGKRYRVGDQIGVLGVQGGTLGTGFSAKVEQTGLAGSVKKIAIINSGLNYASDVILNVFSDLGDQSAKVIGLRGAVTNYPGYFLGNRGKVSVNKKIQDGHYYQDFSYELKSRVSFQVYFDVLKKIVHPSGMRMFGSILVKDAIQNTTVHSSQYTDKTTSVIGRYTPYAFRTFNNLRLSTFLPNQVRGATLQVWLSTYNIAGNTTSGVTAGWASQGLTAQGVNQWIDLARGVTYSVPVANDAWVTPRFAQETVNTHPSLVFRPINESGSDFRGSDSSLWRSYGYWGGLTVGALGLTSARSYFVVAKGRTATDIGNLGDSNSRFLIGDSGVNHGLVFGKTGGTQTPKVIAYNFVNSTTRPNITANVTALNEWFLVCNTYTGTPNGSMSLFLNGVCAGTVTSSLSTDIFIANSGRGVSLGIGMVNQIDTTFDGEIAEVVCYQGDVGKTDREKIEGYLAHKYGLAGKLPSTHPFKNAIPGVSLSGGTWGGGVTGDFYPNGYNPYIGSTSQVGPNGTTASPGSLFLRSSLGYTYNVADEFGRTAHNPIGMPLGSTASFYRDNENTITPDWFSGLALWLRPENIGVCGSAVAGASMDVWRDSSPSANHAVPPTWDRFIPQTNYAGITIDKLRPTLSIANGITGVSFGGGQIFSPWVTVSGTGKTLGGLGISFAPGGSGDVLLTARHCYLTRGITLNADCDVFVVFKPTGLAQNQNQSLVSSAIRPRDMSGVSAGFTENVISCRDWNTVDRNPSVQNDTTYYSILNGVKRYFPIVGPLSFVPYHGTPTLTIPVAKRRSISYDPHVCGLCFDRVVAEVGREADNTIFAYYNGDRATNRSPSTGLPVVGASGESETSLPLYEYPISFGRFGGFVWGDDTTPAVSGTVGSSTWLTNVLGSVLDYSFSGVINEVIVYNRKLTEVERQAVYSYLSRKYRDLERNLPTSYRTSRYSAYPLGISFWNIEQHPNTKNLNTITKGSEFSGIVLQNFFGMPSTIYKSLGTPKADGTTFASDTYDTV